MALGTECINQRPECVSFAFGRVWYAGTESARWGTTVFYSQVMTDVNRAGKCYQEADPTAEEINGLIDSDGGTIDIPDVGKVIKLVSLRKVLIVVADNGIWGISGGSDGFAPLNYFVDKITDVGCISKRSVTIVEDTVMFAARDGLYQVGFAEGRGISAVNITEPKIDTHYSEIPFVNLQNSIGNYCAKEKVFRLYHGDTANKPEFALCLRLKNGAWYPWSFDVDSGELSATFWMTFPFYSPKSGAYSGLKYLIYADDGAGGEFYSFQEHDDAAFRDFGEADISAHLELAALTLDNPQFDKMAMYATHYFEITETKINSLDVNDNPVYDYPSSALLTPKWEWATGGQKQGRQRQVYRFREVLSDDAGNITTNKDVVVSRDKIRGHGKALGLRYDTESGKDLRLIGITLPMSMDGTY